MEFIKLHSDRANIFTNIQLFDCKSHMKGWLEIQQLQWWVLLNSAIISAFFHTTYGFTQCFTAGSLAQATCCFRGTRGICPMGHQEDQSVTAVLSDVSAWGEKLSCLSFTHFLDEGFFFPYVCHTDYEKNISDSSETRTATFSKTLIIMGTNFQSIIW